MKMKLYEIIIQRKGMLLEFQLDVGALKADIAKSRKGVRK